MIKILIYWIDYLDSVDYLDYQDIEFAGGLSSG